MVDKEGKQGAPSKYKRDSVDPIYESLLETFQYASGKLTLAVDEIRFPAYDEATDCKSLATVSNESTHIVQINFRGVTLKSPPATGVTGHREHLFEYDLSLHSRMFDVVKLDVFLVRAGPRTNLFMGRARIHLHALTLKDCDKFSGEFPLSAKGNNPSGKKEKQYGKIRVSLSVRTDGQDTAKGMAESVVPSNSVQDALKSKVVANESAFAKILSENPSLIKSEVSDSESEAGESVDNYSTLSRANKTSSPTFSDSISSSADSPRISPSLKKSFFFKRETSNTLSHLSQLYAVFFRTSMPMSKAKFVRCMMHISRVHEALTLERTNEIVRDKRRVKTAGFFLAYSQACYGTTMMNLLNHGGGLLDMVTLKTDFKNTCRYLGLAKEDIFVWDFSNSIYHPNVFVAHDKRINAIVIAIRGSWSIQDVVTDLVCEYVPFRNSWVHGGIMLTVQKLLERHFKPIIEKVRQLKPKALYITGHSLGGAVSILTCILLHQHLDLFQRLTGNPNFRIHCYAFSPPPVASSSLCEQSTDIIDVFVNENELVPRLSYSSALDYKKLIVATSEILGRSKLKKEQKLLMIAEKRKEIISNSEMHRSRIYIPGTIYLIYKTKRSRDVVPTDEQRKAMEAQYTPDLLPNNEEKKRGSFWSKVASAFSAKASAREEFQRGPKITREPSLDDKIQEMALTAMERDFHAPLFPYDFPELHHYVIERSRKEFFTDLRFRGNMITDHFPTNIEKSLKHIFSWLNYQSQVVPSLTKRAPPRNLTPKPIEKDHAGKPSSVPLQDEADCSPMQPPSNCSDVLEVDLASSDRSEQSSPKERLKNSSALPITQSPASSSTDRNVCTFNMPDQLFDENLANVDFLWTS